MKVLANDGISPSAIELLQRAGIEIIENKKKSFCKSS